MKEYEGRVPPIESFYRRLTAEQLGKIVDSGLTLLDKQDSMLEKQDEMLKGQGMEEIKGLRRDLVSLLDERITRLEREVAEIKARLSQG